MKFILNMEIINKNLKWKINMKKKNLKTMISLILNKQKLKREYLLMELKILVSINSIATIKHYNI